MHAQQHQQYRTLPTMESSYYQQQHNHQRKMVVRYQPPTQLQSTSYNLPPIQQRPRYVFSARQQPLSQLQPLTSMAFANPVPGVLNGNAAAVPASVAMGASRSARTSPQVSYGQGGAHTLRHADMEISRPATMASTTPSTHTVTPDNYGYSQEGYQQQNSVTAFANAGPPGYQWDHQQGHAQVQQQQYYEPQQQYHQRQHYGQEPGISSSSAQPQYQYREQHQSWRQY